MNKTFSEMPEPYKSEIDAWIKAETNIRKFHRDVAFAHMIGMSIVGLMLIGFAIHFLVTK